MLVLIRCVSTELNIPMPSRGWNMEKQLRNGLFMWIKHWSQGAALLDAPSIQEQILAKLRVTRSTEKPEDFKRVLREQLQILHYFAVQAAAALIADPFDAPITRDHVVVQWLNKMLQETSPAKSTSNIRDAVGQFLQGNHMQWGCLTMALDQCYTRETDEVSRFVADMWFLAVVELMEMCPGVQRPMAEMLHLVLCRIGKDNLTIRRNALKLLQLLSASNGRWEEYDGTTNGGGGILGAPAKLLFFLAQRWPLTRSWMTRTATRSSGCPRSSRSRTRRTQCACLTRW